MTQRKNVSLIEGAGYVRSQACIALEAASFIPVICDKLSTGWRNSVKFAPLVVGDLMDKKSVNKVFSKYKRIAFMHSEACINALEAWKARKVI